MAAGSEKRGRCAKLGAMRIRWFYSNTGGAKTTLLLLHAARRSPVLVLGFCDLSDVRRPCHQHMASLNVKYADHMSNHLNQQICRLFEFDFQHVIQCQLIRLMIDRVSC